MNNILQFNSDNNGIPSKYSYIMLLVLLYLTVDLVATVSIYKIVKIGPGIFPGGIIILPIVFIIECIVTDVYGYTVARMLIWYIFICDLVFSFLVMFIINLPSPSFFHNQAAYDIVLGPALRSNLSAYTGILTGRFLSAYLVAKLKIIFRGRYFELRCFISSFVGQIAELTIAGFLIYVGNFSLPNIEAILISDFVVRIFYLCLGVIPAGFLVAYIKRKEGREIYDHETNFNPFKL